MAEAMSRENMETPPPEQPVRRTTRSALVEIPARMGALSVSDNRHNVRMNGTAMTNLLVDVSSPNIPSSFVSPAPSPDEMVIAQRGRRRLPVTWSPDMDARIPMMSPNKERTPVKYPSTIVLRSTPRKRLLLNDSLDTPSPEKKRNISPSVKGSPGSKRLRSDRPIVPFCGPLNIALRAFPKEQLIEIIQGIVSRNPSIEEDVKQNLPAPDMRLVMDKLHDLKKNIFKSLPTSRLTSKTDSPAYTRASTHVMAFKKVLLEEGRVLVSSQQWEYVIEYATVAWEIVARTPVWDNPPHNAPRRHCFKFLASQISAALKSSSHWTQEQLDTLQEKLKGFIQDSEDIVPTLKLVESMVRKK